MLTEFCCERQSAEEVCRLTLRHTLAVQRPRSPPPLPFRNVNDAVPLFFITARARSFRAWLIPRGQSARASSAALLFSEANSLCSWTCLRLQSNKMSCAVIVACIVFSACFSPPVLDPSPLSLPPPLAHQTLNPTTTRLSHISEPVSQQCPLFTPKLH